MERPVTRRQRSGPILFALFLILSLLSLVQCTDTLDRRRDSHPSNELELEVQARSPSGILQDTSTTVLSSTAESLAKRNGFSYPQAFDTSIGSNFTSATCPQFFHSFLSDQNLANCIPISLMLQNSASFFEATKTKLSMNKVLSAACSVTFPICNGIMASYANQMLSSSACLDDFNQGNPVVKQAYSGLLAYQSLFQSTCTKSEDKKDPASYNNYCFTNAITNLSSPTNSYIYYLPLGLSLPSGAMPTCDWCLQKTMSDFSVYARNASLPISLTYPGAASSVNIICGPNFVKAHVKMTGAAARIGSRSSGPVWLTAAATVLIVFFLS